MIPLEALLLLLLLLLEDFLPAPALVAARVLEEWSFQVPFVKVAPFTAPLHNFSEPLLGSWDWAEAPMFIKLLREERGAEKACQVILRSKQNKIG